MVSPYFDIFWWVQRVTSWSGLTWHVTPNGIIAQHAGRSQQHYTTLQRFLAQSTGQHSRDDSTLRMPGNTYLTKPSISLYPVIDVVGILNLIGNSHLLEIPLTLAVSVEVETNAGNALSLKLMGNAAFQTTIPVAREAMTQNHNGTIRGHHIWGLQISNQFPVITLNNHPLCTGTRETC